MMNKRRLYKYFFCCLFFCSSVAALAQPHFKYMAVIEPVAKTGFYAVNISPDIAAKAYSSLSDCRIFDAAGVQVPYLYAAEKLAVNTAININFPITATATDERRQHFYVVKNEQKHQVESLVLIFQNTNADRSIAINGSDDGLAWYAIKENIAVQQESTVSGTSFLQELTLPVSNYLYYKVTIIGKDLIPIKLLKAGIVETGLVEGKWVPLPDAKISRKDSTDKHSYYSLKFSENFCIDKLQLNFSGANFFQRQLMVYAGSDDALPLRSATVRSSSTTTIPIGEQTSKILLVIDNKDNPPLSAATVKAFMLQKKLLTYLKSGEAYRLYFGDSALVATPSYDLDFFRDSIPKTPAQVILGAISDVPKNSSLAEKPKKDNRWITWVAIGFVLLLLVLITAKLTTEVNASRNKTTE
jgi:hypothetical protein